MRMRRAVAGRSGLITVGVLALLAAGASGLNPIPAKAQPAPAIGFSTPTVMDPIHAVGEPTIVVSPASDNTVYSSGPWGTGTQRSIWDASADRGRTFRLVQQCAPQSGQVSAVCPPPTAVQGSPNPPGGGDTDQRLDSTGKDYFADLWALACDRVATTTDHGATANQNAYGCNSPSVTPSSRPDGSDRQWLSVFDPHLTGVTSAAPDSALAPLAYMEYNNLQTTQTGCSYWVKSTDGISYSPANNDNGNFGCDGYPSVDQRTGDVLEASDGGNNTLALNIGVPDATGNLCFLDDPAAITIGGTAHNCAAGGGNALGHSLITVATGLAGSPSLLFTVSSIDRARNLHITFAVSGAVTGTSSTYQVFTTVAPAADPLFPKAVPWSHWATPVQVSGSPSNVNVFPWVVAGGPGRSDSAWYGTSSFTDPSTNGGQSWFAYMGQTVWPVNARGAVPVAADGSDALGAPAVTMVQASPHPMHYNSICLLGTGCITAQGDRNLADFFSVTIDHAGAALVQYDDTSNGLIQPGFTPTSGLFDHPGAPLVTIARQDSGPGLYGTAVSTRPNEPTAAPTTQMTDPSGDARYPVIGGANIPGMDLVRDGLALSANGQTVRVTMKIADLSAAALQSAASAVTGSQFLQYVTRWQMGNVIYYAIAETQVTAGTPQPFQFYAGAVQSIDLCSVSACDPHVLYYPDAPAFNGGGAQTGGFTVSGGMADSGSGTITIPVPIADVGGPTRSSLLEEVGSYAFGSAHPQSAVTNTMAEVDQLPLEVDGACCFNSQGKVAATIAGASWTPALLGAGAVLIAAGARRRKRLIPSPAQLAH
jgi:hypothetical protein